MSRPAGKLTGAVLPISPADDKKVHRCEGWAASKKRRCRNPIGLARIKKRQVVTKNLTAMSLSDAVDSEYLLELIGVCLCVKHSKDEIQVEDLLEKFQKALKDAAAVEDKKLKEQEARLRASARGSRQTTPASAMKTERTQNRRASRQLTPEIDDEAEGEVDDEVDDEVPDPAPVRLQRVRGSSVRPPLSPPATPQIARRTSFAGRSRSTTPDEPLVGYARAARALTEVPDEVVEVSDSETDESEAGDDGGDAPAFIRSWTRYQDKWSKLERYGRRKSQDLESIMPWPVLSGEYHDVNADNVYIFYQYLRHACRDDDQYIVSMRQETERWSKDNLAERLSDSIFRGVYRRSLRTILKVVQDNLSNLVDLPVS